MAHSTRKHETATDGPFYEASFVLWFFDINCFTLAAHAVGAEPRRSQITTKSNPAGSPASMPVQATGPSSEAGGQDIHQHQSGRSPGVEKPTNVIPRTPAGLVLVCILEARMRGSIQKAFAKYLRAGIRPSGLDFGRTLICKASTSALAKEMPAG